MENGNQNTPLRLVGIGCGSRTRTYLGLAAEQPGLYSIAGAADPVASRVEHVYKSCGQPPSFRRFDGWESLLEAERFADVAVVGTQDAYHKEPCLAAMEKGYDILLEKPIATTLVDVLEIEKKARELGRKVLVCHVLRYSPFYRKIKELLQSGILGELVSLNATEGVMPWHQAHSYVRGHWAVAEKCAPMIIAKCCHDLDIISWLCDSACSEVTSYGELSHFTVKNAPAGAPSRCTDGCPVGGDCLYNAVLYASSHRNWLSHVMDGHEGASWNEIQEWLSHSPWGRCVYRCGNTAVDHQVVAMRFETGITATLTMTAFEEGRHLELFGTQGVLRAGAAVRENTGSDILIRKHNGESLAVRVSALGKGYPGHGGGDEGLMRALHREMSKEVSESMSTSLEMSIQSHIMGFAAEASRREGRAISLEEFCRQQEHSGVEGLPGRRS